MKIKHITMPTYNPEQQVFCINTLSNLGNQYPGGNGSADQIATYVKNSVNTIFNDPVITGLIGNWECVWGPQVVAADGKSLNCKFIAHNKDTNQYVVSIAGTDSKSILDWLLEDLWVGTKIDWPFGGQGMPTTPKISLGTFSGLSIIKGMADTVNGVHVHARDYLQNVKATNVMVTGHSLGGALAPAYALYLNDTSDQWVADGTSVTISCIPVAGATAGDQGFSVYYDMQLGDATTKIWNAKDVVPHAFADSSLSQIGSIYEPTIKTPDAIKATIDVLKLRLTGKDYTPILPDVAGFDSNLYAASTTFETQLVNQHISGYADYYKIGDFQDQVTKLLGLTSKFFS